MEQPDLQDRPKLTLIYGGLSAKKTPEPVMLASIPRLFQWIMKPYIWHQARKERQERRRSCKNT